MDEEPPLPRSDADRRARQAERLGRVLRVLQCILGPGRWDAESLAVELECSTRTVHRILRTLTHAGIPWFYCQDSRCYRVREGFRFPGVAREPKSDAADLDECLTGLLLEVRVEFSETVKLL